MHICKAVGVGALAALVCLQRRRRSRVEQARRRLEKLRFAAASDIGARNSMEDCFAWSLEPKHDLAFITVCDGHSAKDAAEFVSRNLSKEFLSDRRARNDPASALGSAFLVVDKAFDQEVVEGNLKPCGTTVVAAVVLKENLLVAGAGDCRAILSTRGKGIPLAVEHAPSSPSERERINATGAFVDTDGYLGGEIAVTRSIGDGHLVELKTSDGSGPLIPNPEVTATPLSSDREFLVLASDGLWMRDETVISLVRQSLRIHNSPQLAVDTLVAAAVRDSCSKDNVTAVLVCFGQDPPPSLVTTRRRNSRLFARG